MMHHGNHTNVHGAGGGGGVAPHAGPPPGAASLHRHQMHQPIPHQPLPPHQMHHDSRHPMAHSQPSNMGSMAQSMGGMGTPMGVPPPHHGPTRPPHPIRAMAHHTAAQHHTMPPMKAVRQGYSVGGSYGPPAPLQHPAPYQQPPPPPAVHHPPPPPPGLSRPTSLPLSVSTSENVVVAEASGEATAAEEAAGAATEGSGEATHPPLPAGLPTQLANSKEKTPMCLVNELARFNKIKHQYRLTSETGPAHKKIFTVTLRLGETEEYTAEGSSIKRAQHAAASAALTQTRHAFPPPKPHAHHTPPHASARHTGAVMPTVELNALAMKLCQPAVYTAVGPAPPAPPPGARFPRFRPVYPPYHPPPHPHPHFPHPHPHPPYNQMGAARGGGVYRVRVAVGERSWAGEGATPQAARHDAAARALHDLRDRPPPSAAATSAACSPAAQPAAATATAAPQPTADGGAAESAGEPLSLDVKSPVSLVHELALKRNLSVLFSVKSERGPPHMRVFVTTCTVGELETEGEGNGKKVSKKRAAERMLEEMRRAWPAALLRAGVSRLQQQQRLRRKQLLPKKKPRNLIKENGETSTEATAESGDNPISRLAMARHAERARSPQYAVLEERGAPRKREFIVQCDAPPHSATGQGPNKKVAKRRAAHNVLLAMGLGSTTGSQTEAAVKTNAVNSEKIETKLRNEGEGGGGVGGGGEVRQPVPGVLLMPDYSHRAAGQPSPPSNGISEGAATGAVGAAEGESSPGAKDQLLYLSQLLGFNVQFSDFPKRNHGEYLSLVALSTVPPIMCHGGGASTQQSHEQCSRAALRALAHMGLDTPSAHHTSQGVAGAGAKPSILSGGPED